METSERPGRRRRPGGRHVAGRSRHGRGRRRARRPGLVLGTLALAGGVAGLLGANGTFSGAPAESSERPQAAGSQAGAERESRASALPGRAGTAGPRASAEVKAREVQQAVPQKTGETAAPKETATAESGDMVEGSAPQEDDAVLAVPGMDDTDGYRADGPSSHTDRRAAEYFRTHWGPRDKALKHVKDIRTVGGYLRIYTDLPGSAYNSTHAITLCKRGLEYLRAAGVAKPVVFVQARFGENGNPVLANILGPSDRSCSVTHPAPG
ncbi:hypothetical protein [Nonomuraea basaltis]|uniref:hypothetical protein n=1 Tax=Nonomuraea basaltis TaxID=2495887 RepID=UPI00110C6AC9|nr:hypothetical protein [Nonomuraea basaltis]TMR92262.1 hypothetical protein EJK15_45745 [Nonomuraea basaltis]